MVLLEFKVKGQRLKLEKNNGCKLVNKTHNWIQVSFTFEGDDWQNNIKYCIITTPDKKNFKYRVYENTPITLGSESLQGQYFVISVYGVTIEEDIETRITTNQYKIVMSGTNYTEHTDDPHQESVDVITDIYQKLDTFEEGATRVLVDNELNHESMNAITNKAVTDALDTKEDKFNFVERLDLTISNMIGMEF